jgi:hypothetical protein
MFSCKKDRDCRDGYVCIDMAQPNPWGALLIDRKGSGKVCTPPPPPDAVGETGVCESRPAPAVSVPVPVPPGSDAGSDADAASAVSDAASDAASDADAD